MTYDGELDFNLHGLQFEMISSTASAVDPHQPTQFRYHQSGELIWGSYHGDTVTQGHFVGQLQQDMLSICFAHELLADQSVVRGQATSRVEQVDDTLYLREDFVKDGVDHESVCVQVTSS